MEEATSEPNHSLSLHEKAAEVIATTLETYRSKPFSFLRNVSVENSLFLQPISFHELMHSHLTKHNVFSQNILMKFKFDYVIM
uniref:Uncharacterized protein n=1 Tax=Arundo donax TaxID=35708 RepID=A0A0A9FL31_ARUDO